MFSLGHATGEVTANDEETRDRAEHHPHVWGPLTCAYLPT